MKKIIGLLLLLVAGRATAEDNEAKKLFVSMQDKVQTAKTLHVRFAIDVTDAQGKKGTVKGSLILGESQKYRAQAEGKLFGEAVQFTEVSDGSTVSYTSAIDSKQNSREKPIKNAGSYFRAALPREGFLLGSLSMKEQSTWPATAFKLSDFELMGKEKVNGRETQVIRYKLSLKRARDPLSVKVWLDAKTSLPVRIALSGGTSDIRDITETYSEFRPDAKVDARTFEMPK